MASIINTYITNNNIGLKLSGKGRADNYTADNNYDYNGLGISLWSNANSNREIVLLDSLNINNDYTNLRFGIVSNTSKITGNTSIQFNNYLTTLNNRIGLGTTNPYTSLHVKSNIILTGTIVDPNNNLITNNVWTNIGNKLFYNKGFIGIGLTNPSSLLELANSSIILSSSYKIGIGKTNPLSALDVFNNDVKIEDGALFCSLVNSKIGVGNTNPQSSLDVKGDISLSGTLLNLDGTPYVFKTLNPEQWSNSSFNYNNIYYNSGYVGVGIANPSSSLYINGNIRIDGNIINGSGSVFNGSPWNDITINTSNYIYYNNNIGIGTNEPIDLLHLTLINSNLNIRLTDATTNHTSNDGFIIGLDSNQNGFLWNYENASLIFGTSNNERLRITNNGNIGIGTTNPQSLLHLVSSNNSNAFINIDNGLIIGKDSNQCGLLWNSNNTDLFFGTNNEEKLRIKSNTTKINYVNSIKKYPPKTYTSSTNIDTTTSILNGKSVNTQTITLNTDGITYGNGDYIVYFSSYYINETYTIKHLFNNIIDYWAHFAENQYNSTTGNYIGDNYITSDYSGDWVIIKLPYNIILKKYIYYSRTDNSTFLCRCPGEWNIYGSIDGNNFIKIDTGTATRDNYVENKYEKSINNNNSFFLYYGFVINKLALPVDITLSTILNFAEIELYGYENNDVLVINEINNIGIGTNNPQSLLHLYKSGVNLLSFNDQGTTAVQIGKTNDNNAIFWNSNNTALTFKTNNIEIMRIANNGNIGIGNNNPQSLLHLSAVTAKTAININLNGLIIGKDSSQNGLLWNYNNADLIFRNNNSELLRIKNLGNVGIGTTNPLSLLHLYKSGGNLLSFNDQGTTAVQIGKTNDNNAIFWNSNNTALTFKTNNIERMRIANNGNIGIGNNNPLSLLHLSAVTANTVINIDNGLIIGKDSSQNGLLWNSNNTDLIFGTNNEEKLRIKSNSQIGIGTNNPQSLLHLYKSGVNLLSFNDQGTTAVQIGKINDGNAIFWNSNNYALTFKTNNIERMRIANNGNIGIGNNNPQYLLDVNSDINIEGVLSIGSSSAFISNNNVDNDNTSNTYLILKQAGSTNDWCYIRQLGGVDNYKLSFDFYDNTDSRFTIRYIVPSISADIVKEVFKVDVTDTFANGLRLNGENTTDTIFQNITTSNLGITVNNENNNYISFNVGLTNEVMRITNNTININNNSKLYTPTPTNTNISLTPSIYGIATDTIILYQGTSLIYPYSIGHNYGANVGNQYKLYFSIPNNASHKFYINGNEALNINSSSFIVYNNIEIVNPSNPGLVFSFTSFAGSAIGVASSGGSYSSSANSGDMVIRSKAGNKLILQTGANEGHLIINNGRIGIGTDNPSTILDVRKDNIRLSGNIYKTDGSLYLIDKGTMTSISSSNLILRTNIETTLTPTFTDTNNKYYLFEKDGSITFNKAISVDILVVGAGGNGGFGAFSGGGGAGEVIYYPNYTFTPGTYNLTVGTNSIITLNSSEIIKALGGGNGGYINVIFDRALITIDVNFKYISYNNDGTFIINNSLICDILVVGGGGAGGTNSYWGGGGGGAGAVIYLTNQILTAGKYNVNIGLGGSPTDGTGNNGYDTKITNINNSKIIYLAKGGGGGGGSGGGDGLSGGSTGGGSVSGGQASSIVYNTENIPNGIYGNYGGTGNFHTIYRSGFGSGGGGGAGEVGGNAYYTYITVFTKGIGGKGGDGIQISITGTNEFYGGGGGGSISVSGLNIGLGGSGGGGNGSTTGDASRGTDNTGGGGGGGAGAGSSSSGWGYGGNGGSGIVIIRYNVNQEIIQPTTGGSGAGGYGTTQQSKSTQGVKWNTNYSYVNDGYDGTLTKGGDGGSALLNNSYIEQLTQQNFKVGKGGFGISNITYNLFTTKKNYGDGGDGGGGIGAKGVIIIKPNITNSLISTDINTKTLNINNINNSFLTYNAIYPYCSCNVNYLDNSNSGYYLMTSTTIVTFKKDTLVDLLLVAGGGDGGTGSNSGGGGAGTVLYFPNYLFTYGSYSIGIYGNDISINNYPSSRGNILIIGTGCKGLSSNINTTENFLGSGGGGYSNLSNGTLPGGTYGSFKTSANTTIFNNNINLSKPYYVYTTSGTNGTITSGGNGGSALSSGGFVEHLTGTNLIVGVGGNGAIGNSAPTTKTTYGSGGDGNGGKGTGAVVIMKFPIEKLNVFSGYQITNDNTYIKTINDSFTYNNINQLDFTYTKGNVGIGITNPTSLFQVNSNIMLSGNITNYSQDLIIQTPNSTTIIVGDNNSSNVKISSKLTTFTNHNVSITGNLTVNGNITVTSTCNINIATGGLYKRGGTTLLSSSTNFSDTRIKTNINDINDSNASLLVSAIMPKTYNYIDTTERGFDTVIGFIAQQIKEVIPQATQVITEFIPNIYKSFINDNIQIITEEDLTSQLSINDKIKFKDNDNYYKTAFITTITTSNITINTPINGNNCFIYGKEVKDFHTLDKSYIYTTNIGATQDLYKTIKIQEQQLQELNTIVEQQELIFNEISQTLNI